MMERGIPGPTSTFDRINAYGTSITGTNGVGTTRQEH